ncbi:UDP-glucose 4-epimerase-like [Haliotis rubra]|uniref:UDP-glucose 4-epimerase-like n=1 Tax=Haliotis rubra TaxID=36100 RepID=UPI001EE5C1FC|nr:UDP-glucose 4-epimerase-like [Haliotis rubra]
MSEKCILVTGGAGYVGSHSIIELIAAGYSVVVLDNLVNACMESIRRVEEIVGKKIQTYNVDLLDKKAVEEVFGKHKFIAVIHFASLKAVGESCGRPLLYYKANIGGTVNLLEVMKENGVNNLVFSSSATVYGTPQYLPLDEKHPIGGCTNPYGKTKYFIEEILRDLSNAEKQWNIVILRYFNPIGAHKSGKIGEDPLGTPRNLMPFIAQVAVGRRTELKVYGSDYDTPDGTGVRDYIHVVDLAQGHVAAIEKVEEGCAIKTYNLGTGHGYSVLDMVKAFEKASGKSIPYSKVERRLGDLASFYADASLAKAELSWTAQKNLDEMCQDLWRWQSTNPNGFQQADGK